MHTKLSLCVSTCMQCPFLDAVQNNGKITYYCALNGKSKDGGALHILITDLGVKPEACPLSQKGDSVTITYA
jgi:hypothetical protein